MISAHGLFAMNECVYFPIFLTLLSEQITLVDEKMLAAAAKAAADAKKAAAM